MYNLKTNTDMAGGGEGMGRMEERVGGQVEEEGKVGRMEEKVVRCEGVGRWAGVKGAVGELVGVKGKVGEGGGESGGGVGGKCAGVSVGEVGEVSWWGKGGLEDGGDVGWIRYRWAEEERRDQTTQWQWTDQNNHHRRCEFKIPMAVGMKERLYRLRFATGVRSRLPEGNIWNAS